MEPDDYHERNIKTLLSELKDGEYKGVSFIQRICLIGYNQAARTVEYGIEKGVLIQDGASPHLYRRTDLPKEEPNKRIGR